MASRRSARLSANGTVGKDAAGVSSNNEAIATRASSVSKRKVVNASQLRGKLGNDEFASKRRKNAKSIPSNNPAPAVVKTMGLPYSSGDIDGGMPDLPLDRIADPYISDALLISPGTTRLVSNISAPPESPSKSSSLHVKTTTGNILEKAHAHLIETEPRLKPIIEKHNCTLFSPEGLAEEIDPFRSLASGIISQQVSGAAARSIKAKFVALFNADSSTFPNPSQVAGAEIDILRTAGLSQRKAEYIKGLAEKFASGELSTEMLLCASYDEVLEKLIAVRGLGKWSVEMFACFGLKRMDVFSAGDLGVQRGMATFVGRDVSKLKAKGGGKWKYMTEKEMLEISEKFAPYRSVFMWYMWRIEDVDISTFKN